MRVRNAFYRVLFLAVTIAGFNVAAESQFVFRRNTGQAVKPAPTPEQQAQTRKADDLVKTQPAPEQQRSQQRRTDDMFQTPQAPRFPGMRRPQNGEPWILVTPDQVTVTSGSKYGYGVLVWDAGPNHPYAEVWKKVDGGAEEFVVEKRKGDIGLSLEYGKKYTFILTDSGQTLDTVTVVPNRDPKDSPIGMPSRPGRDVEANMTTAITDVGSEADSRTASIMFFAASNANPIVEVGTARPIQSNGRWVFPQGKLVGSGNASPSGMKKVGTKINTFHKFGSQSPGFPELQQSTVYWYIISVQNPDFQTTGQFSTSATQIGVRVVFENIRIIDDSDDLSGGDISVWTWLNHGQNGQQGESLASRSMSTDETYKLNKEILIKNAPTSLTISVSAEDDDCSIGCSFGLDGVPGPINGWYNNKKEADGAGVSDAWDLTRFPTVKNEVYRQSFKLRSPEGGAKLQFEVTGFWEITRAN